MIKFAQSFSKKMFGAEPETYIEYVKKAKERCEKLKESEDGFELRENRYRTYMATAKEELGLDDELIDSLLEDFVKQIIDTLPQFRKYVKKIEREQKKRKTPDYQPLRDLVHKNLGVARNLRIDDAENILAGMMKCDDTQKLFNYIDYIEACAILLKPEVAYSVYTGE